MTGIDFRYICCEIHFERRCALTGRIYTTTTNDLPGDRREQSSLTFFYKIHSGTVSLEKDKYLTPASNLRRTRAYHDSQYTRYLAYSDALKIPFFPGLFHCGIVSLLWRSLPRQLKSLRLSFRLLIQRYAFKHASDLLLANSFNDPSRMFLPFAKF